MSTSVEQEHEALIQFLYQSPVGLIQTTADGEITLINPMAAQLLMPLAPEGLLTNLFDVLTPLAPELRDRVLATQGQNGTVCESLRLRLPLKQAVVACQPQVPGRTALHRILPRPNCVAVLRVSAFTAAFDAL